MPSKPLHIKATKITDAFWSREIDLIRDAVIPYQWDALNDRVEGAEPSWWMHNMKAAARAIAARKAGRYTPKNKLPFIVATPQESETPLDDEFYGFVFQDSDGYKWLEAVAYQLMRCPDAALQAEAQTAIDAICAAQEDDGYLDTCYTINNRDRAFTNLKDHHELYCFGHLVEAAVAWHQATGHDDLLNAAKRFGRCIAAKFGPGLERGCPGHEIAEMALFRLFEETGEAEWRDLANFFLDVRGTAPSTFALEENKARAAQGQAELPVTTERYQYYQAHIPVREMKEAVGHAVRQMYLCSGMADAARENNDAAMLEACKRLWQSTVRQKLYVTGGVGGKHEGEAFSRAYDLPSDTAYSETCAAVGLVFFARRMLQMIPDSPYADVMEQALYNTVLAGMALDGKSFFYVNPLEVDPKACETDGRLRHVKPVRQKWFGCACCPPNIARLVSSLPAYMVTTEDNAAYIHLYIGSELQLSLGGQNLRVKMDANLLRDGKIDISILEGEASGTLSFRIPAWTRNAKIHAAGKTQTTENGYCRLNGVWRTGDTVQLDFPMPIRMLTANPLVRETEGMVCFARGPLVYCAEEKDNGKDLYLLRAQPEKLDDAQVDQIETANLPLPVLKIPVRRVQTKADAPLYQDWTAEETADTVVTLIPYFAWSNRGKGEMRVWLH